MNPLAGLLEPNLVEALNRLVAGGRRPTFGLGGGPRRSPFKGQSVAFRQHRLYVPGDDIRRLDWRVLARTDHAFVREYDDDAALNALLVVDASGSMAYAPGATKAHDAARLAAALAYVMLAGGESTGLLLAGGTGDAWVAASSAAPQLSRIVEALERARPLGPTVLPHALGRAAGRAGRRAVVVVISDLMLPPAVVARGLARLRHARHEVTLVRVLHPDEIRFPFRGWVQFSGLEGEPDAAVQGAVARNTYLDRFARHTRGIREVCRNSGVDFIDHAVGRSLLDTVRDILRRSRR